MDDNKSPQPVTPDENSQSAGAGGANPVPDSTTQGNNWVSSETGQTEAATEASPEPAASPTSNQESASSPEPAPSLTPATAGAGGNPGAASQSGGTWSSSLGGFTPSEPTGSSNTPNAGSPSSAAGANTSIPSSSNSSSASSTGVASGDHGVISPTGADGYRPLGQVISDSSDAATPGVNAVSSSTPIVPPKNKRSPMALAKRARLIAAGVAVGIVLVSTSAVALFLHTSGVNQTTALRNAKEYNVTSVPLSDLSKAGQVTVDQAAQLDINGQLRINNSFVLTPTGTPVSPVTGQIYLSNQNQTLYFYNGQKFESLATGDQVNSIGPIARATAGNGLALSGGTLNNTGVLSLQGLTGALALNGTANQISVAASGNTVTLALPQDIATGSSPTFAAITVPTLTARPGDTGLIVGSTAQDLALQGSSTTVSQSSGGFTTTLAFANPTQDSTLLIPDIGGTICTTAGNCGGGGASISLQPTSPGAAQTGNGNITGTFIAGAFSGNGANLTNLNASNISSGTLAVANGGTGAGTAAGARTNLGAAARGSNSDITSLNALTSINPSSALTIGAAGQTLTLQGSAATVFTVSDSGFTTSLEFATPNHSVGITVPNNAGTIAVAASGPLVLDGNGNLSCPSCLTSSGGNPGVVTVNGFSGAVTVAAGTGINVTSNSNTITVGTKQDISTTSTPTFAGLNLNGNLGVGNASPGFPIDVNGDVNVSGTYRINGTSICTISGCTATGGSGNYIQNGTSLQSANFAIQSASGSNTAARIRGAVGQSANILSVETSTGTALLAVAPGGVGVATASPGYPLDVNGDINTNAALRVNGVAVCSSTSGCTPAPGSSNYIQNGTSLQVANFDIQSAGTSSVGGTIRGAIGQTADLFRAENSGGTAEFTVGPSGNGYFAGSLGVGVASPSYAIDASGDANITGAYRIGGVAICTASGCTASGGSGSYVQNGTSVQTANFAIQSASAASIGGLIRGAASQTADLFDVQDSASANMFSVSPAGTGYIATSFGVGVLSPSYALDVSGDANITGAYRINGVAVCTSSGCAAAGGSNSYIQNTTTLQSANFAIQSAAALNAPTAVIMAQASQTGDLLDLESSGSSIVAAISTTGQAKLGGATAFTSVLNIGTNTTSAAGGIAFGTDTNLYRSGASTLKSDGTLQASTLKQVGADFSTGLQLQSNTAASTRSTNLVFTDNQASPQSISLRKDGSNLVVVDNSGNIQLGFSPSTNGLLFGSSLDTNLYRTGVSALQTDGALTVGGNFTNTGSALFKNTSNSTAGFQVQDSSGSNVLVADTTDRRVGIDTNVPPGYPLDVNGDVNTNTVYRINGTQICDSTGCAPSQGSSHYIHNDTVVQTANIAIQSADPSFVGQVIQAANSQTANLLAFENSSGSVITQVNASGALSVESTSTSGVLNIGTNSTTSAAGGIYFGTDTDLYRSGSNALKTDGAFTVGGNVAVTGTYNGNTFDANSLTFSGASTATIQSATSQALNLTGKAASTIRTTSGDLTLQGGSGTVTLGTSTSLTATGALSVTSGGSSQLTLQSASGTVTLGTSTGLTAAGALTVSSGGVGQLTLTSGSGTIGTASSLLSTNTITGTTLNGTTGINTGASAGTQRIDSSGNLVNIGNITGTGNIVVKPGADTVTAFSVQNAAGSSTLFDVDATHSYIGVSTAAPNYDVDVQGGGIVNAKTAFYINGTPVCTASGCSATSGSGNYIQNGTSLQTAANFNIQGASANSVVGTIRGASSQTADLLDLQNGSGTAVVTFGSTGNTLVAPSTNASGAFAVQQAASGTTIFSIDTKTTPTAANLNVKATNSFPVTGSELITVTDFTNGANWTTTGWTATSTTAAHNSGNTSVLSTSQVTPTVGTLYRVAVTTSGTTAANNAKAYLTLGFGGSQVNIYGDQTFVTVLTAGSTAGLTFTPSGTTYDGTVSSVSVKAMTVSSPYLAVTDSASGATIESRGTALGGVFFGTNAGRITDGTQSANVGLGSAALQNNTTGSSNVGIGAALGGNTTGSFNIGIGSNALRFNSTGNNNVAIGYFSLGFNTNTSDSTAVGTNSLEFNQSGIQNSAFGSGALQGADVTAQPNHINTASNNAAFGYNAGQSIFGSNPVNANCSNGTSGSQNAAFGALALQGPGYQSATGTTGCRNSGFGYNALNGISTGVDNTAIGNNTLGSLTSGKQNVAIGSTAGSGAKVGSATANTFVGYASYVGGNGSNYTNASAIGAFAQVNQSNALILGCLSGVNSCGSTTTNVGIGSNYAPNLLTIGPQTYATGTMSITGTSATVNGSGTTWTSGMAGGYLYFADNTFAQIQTVNSTTQLTLTATHAAVASTANYAIVYGGVNVTATDTVVMQPTSDSTSAFQIQKTDGTALLTADTSGLVITVAGNTTTFASLTITNAHFKSTQTNAPTVGGTTNCGSSPGTPTLGSGSTDNAGSVTINTGTTPVTGCQVTITPNKDWGANPKSVILTPANQNAASMAPYTTFTGISPAGHGFNVIMNGVATSSSAYTFNYWVIE